MAHENSPSSVMYADFKGMGLSNHDVAIVLMDADRSFGDSTLRDRIDSRTQLSRAIVHVAPGEVGEYLFRDFTQSSQVIMGRIVAKQKKQTKDAVLGLSAHYSGEAAQEMQQSLREYGIDESIYRNAIAHITHLKIANEVDRALLYLMLFVVTGCTGDPGKAARVVEEFSSKRIGKSFRTTEAMVGMPPAEEEGQEDDGYALGLMRIVGGRLKGMNAFYPLAATEQGTELGSLASGAGAITDVDEDVSRHHARIYKQGGHWYIVGMKSTNGTSVIGGDDKMEHVVEPPKRDRPRDYTPEPYEIFPTDTICLGMSTRFMVMPVMG